MSNKFSMKLPSFVQTCVLAAGMLFSGLNAIGQSSGDGRYNRLIAGIGVEKLSFPRYGYENSSAAFSAEVEFDGYNRDKLIRPYAGVTVNADYKTYQYSGSSPYGSYYSAGFYQTNFRARGELGAVVQKMLLNDKLRITAKAGVSVPYPYGANDYGWGVKAQTGLEFYPLGNANSENALCIFGQTAYLLGATAERRNGQLHKTTTAGQTSNFGIKYNF